MFILNSKRRLWRYILGAGCIAMATCVLLMMPGQGSNKHSPSVSNIAPLRGQGVPRWNDYLVDPQDQDKLLLQFKGKLQSYEENVEDNAIPQNGDPGVQQPMLLNGEEDHLEKKMLQTPVTSNSYFMEVQNEVKTIFHPSSQTCGTDNGVFILIGVFSAFHRHELRASIRDTWGSSRTTDPLNIKVIFIMGNPFKRGIEISKAIFAESKRNTDMLLLDIDDDYRTLSLKMLGYLNWVNKNCANVKYVMKTDDDIFINIHTLAQEVQTADTQTNLMMGHVIEEAQPIRDKNDKWYMPLESYYNSMYPNYLSGTAYIISRDLVEKLLAASREIKVFWLEDIFFTGFLPMKTLTPLIHNKYFNNIKTKHAGPCFVKNIVSMHKISPSEMQKLFHSMTDPSCDDNGLHLH